MHLKSLVKFQCQKAQTSTEKHLIQISIRMNINNCYIFSVDLCKDVSCIDPYVKHVKGILAPDVQLDTPERKWYVLPSRLFPTAGNASLVLLCSCKTYFKTIPFKIQTSKKTDSFISDKKQKERHSKF